MRLNNVKFLFRIIIFVSLLFCTSSCEEDLGFPKIVEIPKDGGSIIVKGNNLFMIESSDMQMEAEKPVNHAPFDIILRNDWLTATWKYTSLQITLDALPNNTENKREIIILLITDNTTNTMHVVQDYK